MSSDPLRVAVIGGGIGGVAAANALTQRGLDVRVYE
jgi:salicylate hydroxylase